MIKWFAITVVVGLLFGAIFFAIKKWSTDTPVSLPVAFVPAPIPTPVPFVVTRVTGKEACNFEVVAPAGGWSLAWSGRLERGRVGGTSAFGPAEVGDSGVIALEPGVHRFRLTGQQWSYERRPPPGVATSHQEASAGELHTRSRWRYCKYGS